MHGWLIQEICVAHREHETWEKIKQDYVYLNRVLTLGAKDECAHAMHTKLVAKHCTIFLSKMQVTQTRNNNTIRSIQNSTAVKNMICNVGGV